MLESAGILDADIKVVMNVRNLRIDQSQLLPIIVFVVYLTKIHFCFFFFSFFFSPFTSLGLRNKS